MPYPERDIARVESCETVNECLDAAQEHLIDVLSFVLPAGEGIRAIANKDATDSRNIKDLDDIYADLQEILDDLSRMTSDYWVPPEHGPGY